MTKSGRRGIGFLVLLVAALSMPSWAGGLSSAEVKQFLVHRIALAHIQNDIRANAGAYEDLPLAYARKEAEYLARHGYEVDSFKTLEARIYEAHDALRAQQTGRAPTPMRESAADCEARVAAELRAAAPPTDDMAQQVAEMRAMGVPETTIAKLEAGLGQLDQVAANADQQARETCAAEQTVAAQTVALSQRSQADWDGVRPWMSALHQFSNWYAGNTPTPPVVEARR
ncbi:hypothetical protein JN531_014790 [Flagellatimonas centrodinii]|uniref:hypothetical protein n=1 Tax=Flagellatimonas centrodinii TaxID=2806210 RepID=UPI001FED8EE9|nr:hypothetical protein [Flagellatimonas centrodinii]ULQ46353.1 hypothetical protein JN531_014790 [Flagellatimonas centrodinii]